MQIDEANVWTAARRPGPRGREHARPSRFGIDADGLDRWGRTAWATIGVGLALAGGFWLTLRLMAIVLPVVVAVLLASLSWPVVRWLRDRRVPPLLAVWIVLLGLVGLLGGALAWIAPTIAAEAGTLRSSVSDGVTRIEDWLATGPFHFGQARVHGWRTQLGTQLGSFETDLAKGALSQTPVVAEILGGIILSAVLLVYVLLIASSDRAPAWIDGTADRGVGGVWTSLSGFTRGLVVNALVNAVVMGATLVVLGVPAAGPIAAITFLASFVPLIGAIVSGGLAALVALVAVGPVAALVVVAATVAIHHLEAYVVGPRVIGRRTGLHPVALILAIAVGLKLAGVAGAFLAGPILAAVSGWRPSRPASDDGTGDDLDDGARR